MIIPYNSDLRRRKWLRDKISDNYHMKLNHNLVGPPPKKDV